jgi:hypothetical protein
MMRAPFIFPVFSIPFWVVGIAMAKTVLRPALSSYELVVTAEGLHLRARVFGINRDQFWPINDIGKLGVNASRLRVNGAGAKELWVETGTKRISLGAGLSERELLYLERVLGEEIERRRLAPFA